MLHDIENVYFIDIGFDSHPIEKANVVSVALTRCVDFTSNVMPTKFHTYIATEHTMLPDTIVRNHLDMKSYMKEAPTVRDAKPLIRDFVRSRDVFACFHSPGIVRSRMGEAGLGIDAFDAAEYIDLTYFITQHVEIQTDRWSPQGYSVPPFGTPSFLEICFYGIVPMEKWFERSENFINPLERARKGAILTHELAQHYSVEQMLRETREREEELTNHVCNLH